MVRLALFAAALVGLVAAQPIDDTDGPADALPVDELSLIDVPVYDEVPTGVASDTVPYSSATAAAAAAADVTDTPLSVFPAATSVPINAAGVDDSSSSKRGLGLERRAGPDCSANPQPKVVNFHNVDISSYEAFKADATIASVASNAKTPAGYLNNYKNAPASHRDVIGYAGYSIVNDGKTGYDPQWCADKCNSIKGCVSFNIYFERDAVIVPGDACPSPNPFANIACAFYGTALDTTTLKNTGQWQKNFHVAVAGSNGYTSATLGGPVGPYTTVQSLNTSIVNAPLRDCTSTWSYLGYKLYQSGPYDTSLCASACDAQTDYNAAHPVSGKAPVVCSAFGSYVLSMTNSTGTYQKGQMCTLYTVNVDKSYAVNKVAYNDAKGEKYTYSLSYFYARSDRQPTCPRSSG